MPNIKERATAFLMSRMSQQAYVSDNTTITPGIRQLTFTTEAPLSWKSGQHFKCAVAPYTYRDYTVASWDPLIQQGTFLIDTAHAGAGSQWATDLLPGDAFSFAGPGGGQHQPTAASHLVCIGDTSALGHFQSLFLNCNIEQYFTCAIQASSSDVNALGRELEMPVFSLPQIDHLRPWLHENKLDLYNTTFYLAGGSAQVVQFRNKLKTMGVTGSSIKAAGFWD